jgi:hypothetical protein
VGRLLFPVPGFKRLFLARFLLFFWLLSNTGCAH